MTTTTIQIKDYQIKLTAKYYHATGDGFNEPYEPANWDISEILLNGEDIDADGYNYLCELLDLSELELDKLFTTALNKQDYIDWEMCQTFI